MNGKQSRAMAFVTVSLVLFVILVAVNFIRPVISAVEAGNDQAYADAIFFNFLAACAVAVVIIGAFLIMVPAAVRRRRIRRSIAEPDVFLATGRGTVNLRRQLRAGNFFGGRQVKKNVPGWTFTVSATSVGVRFWVGMINPVVVVDFPWTEVEGVATGVVDEGIRDLIAIELRMRARGTEEPVLLFALGGEGILTGVPRGRVAVEEVAQALEALRRGHQPVA